MTYSTKIWVGMTEETMENIKTWSPDQTLSRYFVERDQMHYITADLKPLKE